MSATKSPPPADQPQRAQALDPARSILVQAPAGSGKTTLLTERFLTLLAQVDEPSQVVAITFTNAAAAEMRHRVLDELRKDQPTPVARRALERSTALGWNLIDLPAQLRISTIDSFCRDLALQQPLLSGLGGGLAIAEQPADLYRRAARQTLEQIDHAQPDLRHAIAALLQWRDNNWHDTEDLLVQMLSVRDRWMHAFVLEHEQDWEALRERLELPFARAVLDALSTLHQLLDLAPGAREEALELARFACAQTGNQLHRELAELAEFPCGPFHADDALEDARQAYLYLAKLVLTDGAAFRKAVDKRHGFPADRKSEKARVLDLVACLAAVPGLEAALAAVPALPPARYTEEDWQIVRACFTLLRHAAAELQVVFAEAGAVDFIEVAQIAQRVLTGPDGLPTDAAIAAADGIRHLLVDEFQDTSRRQHQLLAALIASWPDRPSARAGRTCFLVGDPMQSIYFFRDADAELFPRVRDLGLDIPPDLPLTFDFVPLRSNFRTAAPLVEHLNEVFTQVFAAPDGSGVTFTSAQPARDSESASDPRFHLHLQFAPQTSRGKSADPQSLREKEAAGKAQLEEIVALIRNLQQSNSPQEAAARSTPSTSPILHENPLPPPHPAGDKYRIAVLARARKSLAPIAQALREAAIPFRAVELEKLADRPEVLDALALARALLNPYDRVAWLGVLRAPWCGLSLDDLHILASADDPALLARPVPGLLAERLPLLSPDGRLAVQRLINTLNSTHSLRSSLPTTSPGTWLLQVWRNLGGAACVDATANANLDLLWSCLDRLPAGEQDLLGPALNAALDKLTALPDPNAGSDNGVQLMTIHKSKGLEFEVVIVPDLQAGSARGSRKLLSWLERGLATPDDSGEITEFLVAPLQSKGADRGKAKAWVDQVYRQRESQEDRRILYVAATRAREELHLFAQPAYKIETGGDLTLPNPSASLLATAWPALEEEVRARFEDWKSARISAAGAEDQIIDSLAASAETNLLLMPTLAKPTILHRLPPDYQPCAPSIPRTSAEWVGNDEPQPAPSSTHEEIPRAPSIPRSSAEWVGINEPQPAPYSFPEKNPGTPGLGSPGTGLRPWGGVPSPLEIGESTLYPRHQGNQLSRALGTAVHALLEQLARLRATNDWDVSRAALVLHEPRIAAQVRASGVDPTQAGSIAAQAIAIALDASRDPNCQWILSSHPGALSEVRWTGILNGALTSVRVDRVFRAGLNPQSEGNEAWWIVDYKTAHAENLDPAAAALQLRPLFTPQLEAYAEVLRNLHGPNTQIRAALYYPRMLLFDWWQI